MARPDRSQRSPSPRIAHRRCSKCRVHPPRTTHRDGRSRDSGGDRHLQPPRGGGLCGGGSLPVGLRNDDRGGHRLPGANGQLSRGFRVGHHHGLGSRHCAWVHSRSSTERNKRRPLEWRALGLRCDVAKPWWHRQRGPVAQRDAGEPGQVQHLGRERWNRHGPGARRGWPGPRWRHPHREGLQCHFGWGRPHVHNDHSSSVHNDHRRADDNHDHATNDDIDDKRSDDDHYEAPQPGAQIHQRWWNHLPPRRLRFFHGHCIWLASSLAEALGCSAVRSQLRSCHWRVERYAEEVGLLPTDLHGEQRHSAECNAVVHADHPLMERVRTVLEVCSSRRGERAQVAREAPRRRVFNPWV